MCRCEVGDKLQELRVCVLCLQRRVVVCWVCGSGACVLLVESFGFNSEALRSGSGAGAGTRHVALCKMQPLHCIRCVLVELCCISMGSESVWWRPVVLCAVRVVRQYPFTPERKMMSTLVALDPRNPDSGPVRLYVTGPSVPLVHFTGACVQGVAQCWLWNGCRVVVPACHVCCVVVWWLCGSVHQARLRSC